MNTLMNFLQVMENNFYGISSATSFLFTPISDVIPITPFHLFTTAGLIIFLGLAVAKWLIS